ncbi:unnamed protein product [Lota lota]
MVHPVPSIPSNDAVPAVTGRRLSPDSGDLPQFKGLKPETETNGFQPQSTEFNKQNTKQMSSDRPYKINTGPEPRTPRDLNPEPRTGPEQ